jgi:hypothetical protein
MQPVIGCDAHKHFSVFVSVDQHGKASRPVRVELAGLIIPLHQRMWNLSRRVFHQVQSPP